MRCDDNLFDILGIIVMVVQLDATKKRPLNRRYFTTAYGQLMIDVEDDD
jgi:hypothetical protein